MGVISINSSDGTKTWKSNTTEEVLLKLGGHKSSSVSEPIYKVAQIAKMPLADTADTGGAVLSWQNNTGGDIIITRFALDVTTKSTGASTIDAGTTATNATTSSDNLVDGLDTGAAAGYFDNVVNAGTNGKGGQRLASGKWLTVSRASGAVAGLAGYAYVHFFVV